ncbi:N-acetylmuramic acid 6-phosphate [Pluteus cervinus]|uniref:N-acetylmuramic acid 6-phosphate n=1 Tax=Pluteus cervinus TaxID=181527 RepID=A0ACD3AIE8_9AGAR|nr:N-acetylmuramic acid 6-phosphate [Pluteus cervinus]
MVGNATLDSINIPLGSLQTEAANPDTAEIDVISTEAMCRIMNQQDMNVPLAVGRCIPKISRIIDVISERMRDGGRLVYIGAGTSGRLGVLDASEIPPTFSAPSSQFIGIIAGGDSALRKSIEGAEDSSILPIDALSALSPPLTPLDTLIGIASSGRTPYVLAGMKYAKDALDMLTIGIACVDRSEMRMKGCCGVKEDGSLAKPVNDEDCAIECVVGPEIVAGSTRMKAGTATKLILNMISTGIMIKLGKTYGNMMIDVKSSNNKLADRARRIFQAVVDSTPSSFSESAPKRFTPTEIDELIKLCDGSVKTAIVVAKLNCSIEHAKELLTQADGVLKKVLLSAEGNNGHGSEGENIPGKSGLFLCIDAGGSRCKAVIASKDGIVARSEGGPCNLLSCSFLAPWAIVLTYFYRVS